jgi:excinuclease UvrABC ATPase subunit
MCRGSGFAASIDETLIIASRAVPPTDERFLHPGASEILRGVRRNELLPFLRRLAAEGLWDLERPFSDLASADRDLLLHGFWCRPGHGSFLKRPDDDPNEVGSWLRWDGLVSALDGQLERSRDAAWRAAVAASRSQISCPLCEGTGLGAVARLVRLGELSLHELIRDGDARRLRDELLALRRTDRRSGAHLDRLLECIEPVAAVAPSLRLREAAPPSALPVLVERLALHYTDMPVVR